MRAALYARYSSDQQRDASIEDQLEACRRHAAARGWTVIEVHTDRAQRGASRCRPGYQRLLAEAGAGGVDVVLAEALDRLSRDQEDVAALFKRLAFAGVALVTLAEGAITELHVGLTGTMNALFLKQLAQKTRRGLAGRVRQGRSAGGLCYGYAVVRRLGPDGAPETGLRRIDAAEAAVVRRIFAEFAAGRSPRAIARGLNADGVPGPGGRPWGDTTIRGHHGRGTGILRNELYVGRQIWNRQRFVKDPATGRRVARPNPETAWEVVAVPELRIVDDALWRRVQARLGAVRASAPVAKLRAGRYWEQRRPQHLLTGLVACGACGGALTSVGRHYLACGRARRQGTCASRASIPRPALERLILDALKARLLRPELVQEFVAAFHAELNARARERELGRERLRRERDEVARQLEGLIAAIADGLRSPGLQAKLDALEGRKAALAAELAAAPAPAPVRLHPNLGELYRRRVAHLHEALAAPATRAEALELLRGLIERVVLHPIPGGFEIELVGAIASMVALAATADNGNGKNNDNKKAALPGEAAACSVKVVAGAFNHRQLTLPAVVV